MLDTLIGSIIKAVLGVIVSIVIIAVPVKIVFPETINFLDIAARDHLKRVIPWKYLSFTGKIKKAYKQVF